MTKLEREIINVAAYRDGYLKNCCTALARFNRRRDRLENPDGWFDNAGRWWPAGNDVKCCGWNRQPTRAYPYSWLVECRTQRACELRDEGDAGIVRQWLRRLGVDPRKEYDASRILRRVRGSLRASRFKIAA